MDGNFLNQTPGATGTGASSSGDVSCAASVASSMESSVSSAESGTGLRSSLRGKEIMAMTESESGSLGGEPPSPLAASIEATTSNTSGTDNNQSSGAQVVEPINPFDQVAQQNSTSADSASSVNTPSTAGVPGSVSDNTPLQAALSPDRPIPTIISDPSTPLHTGSSSSILPGGSDGSAILLHSVPTSLSNAAPQTGFYSEDDNTEPSSAVTSSSPGDPGSSTDGQDTVESDSDHAQRNSSITRFIGNSRRRTNSNRADDPAFHVPDIDDDLLGGKNLSGSLIGGYLQKLGRNGKWQTRWFETDGECLSYYKSQKRTKLLATLDLEKVGSIEIDPEDNDEISFNIQVLGRLYHLRADSKASCKDWVITLNRVKEARMQQGNVKLVSLPVREPVDLLDTPAQSDDFVTPRVVVLANRQRTRAVEEEQELNQLIRLEESAETQDPSFKSEKRLSTLGTVVLARWTKRRSSLSRLRSKFAKWARSLRRLSCTVGDMTGLDHHVHPPGHDDHKSNKEEGTATRSVPSSSVKKKKDNLSGWIGKEATLSSRAPQTPGGLSPRAGTTDIRPRKNSTASSEQDIRVLS